MGCHAQYVYIKPPNVYFHMHERIDVHICGGIWICPYATTYVYISRICPYATTYVICVHRYAPAYVYINMAEAWSRYLYYQRGAKFVLLTLRFKSIYGTRSISFNFCTSSAPLTKQPKLVLTFSANPSLLYQAVGTQANNEKSFHFDLSIWKVFWQR